MYAPSEDSILNPRMGSLEQFEELDIPHLQYSRDPGGCHFFPGNPMSIGLCSHREGHVHWIFTECGPHSKSKPGVYTIRGHIAEVCVELQFFFFCTPHPTKAENSLSGRYTRVFMGSVDDINGNGIWRSAGYPTREIAGEVGLMPNCCDTQQTGFYCVVRKTTEEHSHPHSPSLWWTNSSRCVTSKMLVCARLKSSLSLLDMHHSSWNLTRYV